jgi:flagellar biosynthesis/type III secretory pathway chaperone
MSRQLQELEQLLTSLVSEHRKLLTQVERHALAMRELNLEEMDHAARQQQSIRIRILALDTARRNTLAQLARATRTNGELTITRVGELFPNRKIALNKLRDELKSIMQQIQSKSTVAGKVAGAVLGHLNTAVRIIAGAAQQAGVYTKDGSPRVAERIGMLEAVG